jgi:hypothetical protein
VTSQNAGSPLPSAGTQVLLPPVPPNAAEVIAAQSDGPVTDAVRDGSDVAQPAAKTAS